LRSGFVGYVLVTLLVLNLFVALVKIQPVQAQSAITILADGSIQPSTAPIQRTGSLYTLTENITFDTPGFVDVALRIECSNITFDGNGFALDAPALGTCIYVTDQTNVTIKNTIVTSPQQSGINFYQCYNCTVTQNVLFNCGLNDTTYTGEGGAIMVWNSEYFDISQNIMRVDSTPYFETGIRLSPYGWHSGYHNVSNNQIYNYYYGIRVGASPYSIIQSNMIANASCGIVVDGNTEKALLLNNSIFDSDCGIGVDGESQSNTISGNNIHNSRYAGIYLEMCQDTVIAENNVTNTWENATEFGGFGIEVGGVRFGGGETFNVISKNRVVNSTSVGISVNGDGQSVTDNYAANNGGNGILLKGDASYQYTLYSDGYVSRNYAANNGGNGIEVDCNDTVVSANIAVNNSGSGIYLGVMYHSRIFDNEISNNTRGLGINQFGNNSIYHNHFTNNTKQVYYGSGGSVGANSWDDGYPSGGNYWSNYIGVDLYKGPNQDILGSDGIGDTPYAIFPINRTDNVDRYPRVSEPPLGALDISPNYGGNTGNVTVRVTGVGFIQGIVAKLVRSGFSNITGSQPNIINSTQLTTTFNLVGIESDTIWDLVVIYPNGTELKLEYAFKVMLGGEPVIYADIKGRNQLRVADSLFYTVRIYNKGNVDAIDQLITLNTDPALKILSVKDSNGKTVWNRTALQQTITDGQLQHPELWQGDSSRAVSEFLNTTILYAPRIGAGDCLTLEVEVYAKMPWNGDDPFVLIAAKVLMETALNHILSQIISSELIFYGVDELMAQQLRTGSYPITGSSEVTQILVEFLLENYGAGYVSAGVRTFGEWGVGALTGLGLVMETAKKVGENTKPETSAEKPIQPVSSYDPNDKVGPTGYGTAVYVPADTNFTYIVYFENLSNATAEAANIVITDTLDADLDWSTLSFGGSSHPDTMSYSFNSTTGTITWIFTSINLPPNVNPPEGEGWVSYSVKPKAGLATGTEIRNKATIVFDVNPPIDTPETLHTVDSSFPESVVQSLPAQSNSSFVLNWSGTDAGSGVKAYSIYFSDNDGPWVVWLLQTQETSATFNGQVGHTYKFYSRAIDQVSNQEETPQDPDATSTVDFDNTPPKTQLFVGSPRYVDLAGTEYVTVATPFSLTAADNEGGFSGVASTSYRLFNLTYDSGWQTYSGAFHFNGVADGNYSLEYRSTDKNGNVETAKETDVVLDSKAPEASVVIDGGATYTNSTAITLQLLATDVLRNTIEVRLSNDNITYTEWEAYAPTKNWTLESGYGVKTVYVQFKDFLGHVSIYSNAIGYVIPEFPSFVVLPLFFLATLLAVIAYRRKRVDTR
jgi:uncharacterized repeat protein (TIGR01451 family)